MAVSLAPVSRPVETEQFSKKDKKTNKLGQMTMDATHKIDYIETPTKDIQKTKDFFKELFGWKFEDFGPDYAAYHDGRMAGGFYKSDTAAAVSSGSVLVVFYSPALEAIKDDVVKCKGAIVKDIFSFPGGRRFHFTDPGGSEFAIWSDK